MTPSDPMSWRLPSLCDGVLEPFMWPGYLYSTRTRRSQKRIATTAAPTTAGDFNDDFIPATNVEDGSIEPPKKTLIFQQSVFVRMYEYFVRTKPEAAGILTGHISNQDTVCDFVPDESGVATAVSFSLNASMLNRVLKERKAIGQTCIGIIHSHPSGVTQPSGGDMTYFKRLFARPANRDASSLFVPIVCDGRVFAYVYANGRIHPAQIALV